MFSLFITLFICLFSYCPSSGILEDHKENNIVLVDDSITNKNMGYVDEYGIQLYMGSADFINPNFIYTFIRGVAGNVGSPDYDIGFDSTATATKVFINNNETFGAFYNVVNGVVDDTASHQIYYVDRIVLSKNNVYQLSYEGEPIIIYDYSFAFYRQGVPRVYYNYWISFPLYNNAAHDLGDMIIRVEEHCDFVSTNPWWVYKENTLNGFAPIVSFYFENRDVNPDTSGSNQVYNNGYSTGFSAGLTEGYNSGYSKGYTDGASTDATASTIFTGILDVALIPVNFFLTIFNFEVFGINISGIVSALLTVTVVIIILRFILGGKKND